MVTAVKYRKALLNSEVEKCITETLKGISERYEIVIDEVGFDQNHIHIFCGAPPRMAPLRVISIIKSIKASKSTNYGAANFRAPVNILAQSETPHQKRQAENTLEIKVPIRKRQKLG